MTLFGLVYKMLEEVLKQEGKLSKEEEIEEKVSTILKHSIIEYNHKGLFLESYSAVGVSNGKEIEVNIPKYITFEINRNSETWKLRTQKTLGDVEWVVRNTEEDSITVVMISGVVFEYSMLEDAFFGRIVWKDPIYRIEITKDNGEEHQQLVHDRVNLEEEIKNIVMNINIESISVFDLIEKENEHFHILGTIFSSEGIETEPSILWGRTEPNNEEINNIWGE